MLKLGFSVNATVFEDLGWFLVIPHQLILLVPNSFRTCLSAFMGLAPGLCKSCCLEIVCSRRHFQLSSRGKEKQFYAWATVNPSLSVPLLDALKSHSPTQPLSHQPLLFCDQGVKEHPPRSEMRMRFTCSLTILSSLMPFTSVPWHLQFPARQWNSILHAGVVTVYG